MEELIEAIRMANVQQVKILLTANPDRASHLIPNQGISPLMLAIYYRNAAIVSIIRPFKKELNVFEASALGDLDFVKQYFEGEQDKINDFSPDGFTCLGFACFFGHLEVAKHLVTRGAEVNIASNNAFKVAPIHSACAISNEEIALLLLENGANVNAKQQNGVTPLHTAAHHGQTKLAQLLLKYGADIHTKMDTGQTSLMMAEEKGFQETIDLLRSQA
jgi:uncharacterized protein